MLLNIFIIFRSARCVYVASEKYVILQFFSFVFSYGWKTFFFPSRKLLMIERCFVMLFSKAAPETKKYRRTFHFVVRSARWCIERKAIWRERKKEWKINWKLNVFFLLFSSRVFNSRDLDFRSWVHSCSSRTYLGEWWKLEYPAVVGRSMCVDSALCFLVEKYTRRISSVDGYRQVVLYSFLLFSFFISRNTKWKE